MKNNIRFIPSAKVTMTAELLIRAYVLEHEKDGHSPVKAALIELLGLGAEIFVSKRIMGDDARNIEQLLQGRDTWIDEIDRDYLRYITLVIPSVESRPYRFTVDELYSVTICENKARCCINLNKNTLFFEASAAFCKHLRALVYSYEKVSVAESVFDWKDKAHPILYSDQSPAAAELIKKISKANRDKERLYRAGEIQEAVELKKQVAIDALQLQKMFDDFESKQE